MLIESQCLHPLDKTIELLTAALANSGWNLTATHNLQQTMQKHGHSVLPVTVLAICKPQHSLPILQSDNARLVSCLMPCRISVYQKADGNTYISRLNPEAMAAAAQGPILEHMSTAAAEIEGIMAPYVTG